MLDKKLFREGDGKPSRMAQAAREAVRAKKAAGAVRYLWRNAATNSHEPVVQEMKDLLRQSPRQEKDADENEGEVEALEEAEAEEAAEPESCGDEADGDASQDEDGGVASGSEGQDADPPAPGDMVLKSPAEDDECGESSETDSLNAPTLKMGENIDSEEDPFPDSQVKTGCSWLSKFYAKGDPDKPEPDRAVCVQYWLRGVTNILKEDDEVKEPLGPVGAWFGNSGAASQFHECSPMKFV